jgi:hypothetical protein
LKENLPLSDYTFLFSRQDLKLGTWMHPAQTMAVKTTITTAAIQVVVNIHHWAVVQCAPCGSQEKLRLNIATTDVRYKNKTTRTFCVIGRTSLVAVRHNGTYVL